jgi:hypothetical protein
VLAQVRRLLAADREHPELNEHLTYFHKRVEQMR